MKSVHVILQFPSIGNVNCHRYLEFFGQADTAMSKMLFHGGLALVGRPKIAPPPHERR